MVHKNMKIPKRHWEVQSYMPLWKKKKGVMISKGNKTVVNIFLLDNPETKGSS